MRRYGHWGLTLVLALPFIILLPLTYSIIFVGMMITMSLFPNKEVALSLLNRRGITHTIWCAVFVGGVIMTAVALLLSLVVLGIEELSDVIPSFLNPWQIGFVFGAGATMGVLSHILGDALVGGDSKPSVQPFWPISRTPIRFGLAKPRNPFVNEGLFRIMVVLTVGLYAARFWIASW